jgi:hypothetical protein
MPSEVLMAIPLSPLQPSLNTPPHILLTLPPPPSQQINGQRQRQSAHLHQPSIPARALDITITVKRHDILKRLLERLRRPAARPPPQVVVLPVLRDLLLVLVDGRHDDPDYDLRRDLDRLDGGADGVYGVGGADAAQIAREDAEVRYCRDERGSEVHVRGPGLGLQSPGVAVYGPAVAVRCGADDVPRGEVLVHCHGDGYEGRDGGEGREDALDQAQGAYAFFEFLV